MAREWCNPLMAEDKKKPFICLSLVGWRAWQESKYAILTLFFELSPEDIGTTTFDEKESKNMRAIIDMAEMEREHLSEYFKYEPDVWSAFF
ncbi:MAG: hypothetical protein JTT11_09825 [Candidatus Brockarchaeota archaeon]|nr:hypothetical protein [Candidatus Brockarchaeota archaeon]